MLLAEGQRIDTYCTSDAKEALGINNRVQLAEAEDIIYDRIRTYWMMEGVPIVNPASVFIDTEAILSRDVVINPFTFIKGKSYIGERAVIGPGTTLTDCIAKVAVR